MFTLSLFKKKQKKRYILSPVHSGAETHTRIEAPTVAANWTDSLVIDLLQVSLGSLKVKVE